MLRQFPGPFYTATLLGLCQFYRWDRWVISPACWIVGSQIVRKKHLAAIWMAVIYAPISLNWGSGNNTHSDIALLCDLIMWIRIRRVSRRTRYEHRSHWDLARMNGHRSINGLHPKISLNNPPIQRTQIGQVRYPAEDNTSILFFFLNYLPPNVHIHLFSGPNLSPYFPM